MTLLRLCHTVILMSSLLGAAMECRDPSGRWLPVTFCQSDGHLKPLNDCQRRHSSDEWAWACMSPDEKLPVAQCYANGSFNKVAVALCQPDSREKLFADCKDAHAQDWKEYCAPKALTKTELEAHRRHWKQRRIAEGEDSPAWQKLARAGIAGLNGAAEYRLRWHASPWGPIGYSLSQRGQTIFFYGSNGISGTSRTIGSTTYMYFSDGTSCTVMRPSATVFVNCH